MQFTKKELQNLIKEEVATKKRLEELKVKKVKLTEEYKQALLECGMGGEMEECDMNMEEHGDGLGLGVNHLVDEEEKLPENNREKSKNIITGLSIENFDSKYELLKREIPDLRVWLVNFYNEAQKQGGALAVFAGKKLNTDPYKSDYLVTFGEYSLKVINGFFRDIHNVEGEIEEHGIGIGLGVNHLVDEEERLGEGNTATLDNLSQENFDEVYKNYVAEFPTKLVDFYDKAQKSGLGKFAAAKLLTNPYKADYNKTFGAYSLKIMLGFLNDAGTDDGLTEEKPSAGLSATKRSSVVKAAKSGKDIGKKGKGFKDVVAHAKESGARDPQAVAAAAMWKNIKR